MAYLGNDLQVAFPVYRNIDDISGSFNSSLKTFPLTVSGVAPVPAPLYSQQCLISVGGVVQRPDDTGSEGFRLSGGNIIFASAPTTGADFFGVILAGADYINAGGNFPSGTAAVPSITFNDDLDTGIYNSGINQVSITTGGSERLRIDSAGQIESVSLGTAAAPAFSFTTDPNSGIYSPGADQVAISTGGSGRLFVDASGRLLVGNSTTTNVSGFNGSFQLQGTNFDTATIAVTNVAANNTGSYLVLGKARGGTLGGYTSVNNGDNLGQIRFMGADGTGYVEAAYVGVTCNGVPGTNNMPGRLFFSTNSGTSSVTERMCITPSGLVGVGTSSPGQLLDVAGIARFGGSTTKLTTYSDSTYAGFFNGSSLTSNEALYMGAGNTFFYNNGSPSVTITSSGRVGVGTTSPSGPLAVVSDSGGLCARLQGRAGDSIGTLQFRDNADTATQGYIQGRSTGLRIGTSSGNPLIFLNDSTEQMRLDSSGRLGIGTSSVSASLHISTGSSGSSPSAGYNELLIEGGNEDVGMCFLTPAANNRKQIISFGDSNNNNVGQIQYDHSSDSLSVKTNNSTALTIDSSQRLGIGTTTVNAKLEVAGGNIRLDNNQGVEWGGSNNYIYGNETTDFVAIATNGNERCRLDSSGRLLVGTSTTAGFQTGARHIFMDGGGASYSSVSIGNPGGASNNTDLNITAWTGSGSNYYTSKIRQVGDGSLTFHTQASSSADGASSPTERMRISRAGDVNIGKTAYTSVATNGHTFEAGGLAHHSISSQAPLWLNRNVDDGNLVNFYQDGTIEGNISVSGTTVSYNGAHLSRWSQLPSGAERTEILRGSILSNIDEMCEWGDENNEQLNRMKVSDIEGDTNVAGVFQAWDDDDDTYANDFYCAMTGDFIIRIGAGVVVQRGDLLMSAGDGTAKPQGDDIVRSKTVAKVTSTNVSCTYEDGSYCVPCVLMAC